MNIVYFGTAQFAVPALRALLADARFKVVAVVSQPDKPAGRKGDLVASPVATVAREAGVTLLQPLKMRSDETRDALAAFGADFFVVAAYGRLIPRSLLDLPKHGCLNLHGSLLPSYRGASPIQAAIAAGETETGVTLMRMDEEIDHGPTYATAALPIAADDTYTTLEAKLADVGATLLLEHIEAVASGALRPQTQDHAAATFTGIIEKDAGRVRWAEQSAAEVERLRRAYTPWPGIYTVWNRNGAPLRLKLLDVAVADAPTDAAPGTAFITASGEPVVACRDGALVLRSVQPEGKKPLDGKTFVNGYQDFTGTSLA